VIVFDQQPDPVQPDRWFVLTLRCPGCRTEGEFRHLTGREAQRWINLFRLTHERAACGFDPHRAAS